MEILNPVDMWIGNVSYSHSQSKGTEEYYRFALKRFCGFIHITPKEIVNEYEESINERVIRKKFTKMIKSFIIHLSGKEYAVGSITTLVSAVRSFFKYNDLPLGYIPTAKAHVTYHNRDIKREEIKMVLAASSVRDRAFYSLMVQAGLRPGTIAELRMKHIEPDLSKGVIPCAIHVPAEISKGKFGAYFTFAGPEAVAYLKAYLSTRSKIKPDDYLFLSRSNLKVLRGSLTNIFARTVVELKEKGLLNLEQKKKAKPRSVRLYNLRKYFRKHAGQAGIEYVNFWMGHKTNYKAPHIPASDIHYFDREDIEFQRKIYKEKAMPHLKLETFTPSMTERILERQSEEIKKIKKENQELKKTVNQLKQVDNEMRKYLIKTGRKLDEKMRKIDNFLKRHPELE